jgi:hypothetical protein
MSPKRYRPCPASPTSRSLLEGGHMVITSEAPIDFAAVKEAVSEAGEYEVVPA